MVLGFRIQPFPVVHFQREPSLGLPKGGSFGEGNREPIRSWIHPVPFAKSEKRKAEDNALYSQAQEVKSLCELNAATRRQFGQFGQSASGLTASQKR